MNKPAFALGPRKPISEDAARRLEAVIAAKGEGVAGQGERLPVLIDREEATPQPLVVAPPLETDLVEPASVELPDVTTPVSQVHELTSSRPRGTTKSRNRELPKTGVGTLGNPRIRKLDGVRTRSTTVHLPVILATKLAVHCAQLGLKQSEVITQAIEDLLQR